MDTTKSYILWRYRSKITLLIVFYAGSHLPTVIAWLIHQLTLFSARLLQIIGLLLILLLWCCSPVLLIIIIITTTIIILFTRILWMTLGIRQGWLFWYRRLRFVVRWPIGWLNTRILVRRNWTRRWGTLTKRTRFLTISKFATPITKQ